MKRIFTLWFVTCVAASHVCAGPRPELPRLVEIYLPDGWREIERGTNFTNQPYTYWVTFQKQTNELLTFLIRLEERPINTNTIQFADTAHEMFRKGYYWYAHTNDPGENIASSVRLRVDAVDRFEALLYSYVAEDEPSGETRLAHGCVLFGEVTVFVQHTSTRPISLDVIDSVAFTVMRRLATISAPKHLRPFHKRTDY